MLRPIVIPPYPGEFGWELMNWQARVRAIVGQSPGRRAIVLAPADRVALYNQPHHSAFEFHAIDQLDLPGHANEDHRIADDRSVVPREAIQSAILSRLRPVVMSLGLDAAEADWLFPPMDGSIWPTRLPQQRFGELRTGGPLTTDVLLVPRDRAVAADRNRPRSWWDELAGALSSRGLRVDLYGGGVEAAIRQLSATRLAIGASTGGLHLAALCRCPHYVWGSGPEWRWTRLQITNRQRYETVWNPLGTPCRYDECGWDPTVERVMSGALRALNAIGLREQCVFSGGGLNPRWRVKRWMMGVLHEGSRRWPWRVQRLVRERLV